MSRKECKKLVSLQKRHYASKIFREINNMFSDDQIKVSSNVLLTTIWHQYMQDLYNAFLIKSGGNCNSFEIF